MVLLGVCVCVVLGAISAGDLRERIGEPYAGFAWYANGVLPGPMTSPVRFAESTRRLRPRDRVIAVDAVPVAHGRDIHAEVARHAPGDVVTYTLERSGGRLEVDVPVDVFSAADYTELAAPLFLGAVLLLALGAAPALLRPRLPVARVFFAFALGGAGAFGFSAYDNFVAYRFVPWSLAFIALMKAALAHLALILPTPAAVLERRPGLVLAAIYGAMFLQSGVYGALYFDSSESMHVIANLTSLWIAGSVVLLGARLLTGARTHPDPAVRQLARIILPAPVIGCVSALLLFASARHWLPFAIPLAVHLAPVWVAFLAVSYAMLQSSLFDLDARLRRGVVGASVLLLGSLAYLVAFAWISRWLGSGAAWVANASALSLLLVLAPSLGALRRGLERRTEDWLHPGRRARVQALADAGAGLRGQRDPVAIARQLREAVAAAFGADPVHVWVALAGEPLAEPLPAEAADRASAGDSPRAALPEGSALAIAIQRGVSLQRAPGGAAAEPAPTGAIEPAAAGERAVPAGARREMQQRDLVLLLPFGGDRVRGGLGLGAPRDALAYARDDVQSLELLAAQAGLAFGNAKAFEALQALEVRLAGENQDLREQLQAPADGGHQGLVGRAPAFLAAVAEVEQVAPTEASVLVLGETGTGKEVLVRTLHRLSKRAERPLEKVACGAIPETLLESEFFGHERGAFTGATRRRMGRLEAAHGGTVFLDDVDALPLAVQAKLLRAVQQGEVQRLGSSQVSRVDVRIVAASNQDLLQRVRDGSFRQDLYYRLAVMPIHVPPLRERLEDLPLLVQHLAQEALARRGGPRPDDAAGVSFSRAFLQALARHPWPGNVRELRNVVQRALVLGEAEALASLGTATAAGGVRRSGANGASGGSLAEQLQRHRLERIRRALERAGGNQSAAAEALGLHRQSLARMMRDLGLAPARGRSGT